jgi:prepilin-type N-terminal cleavage/methylation domain-containing protein
MNAPRRSRGFTLVELMLVVSIIGILSSVAIPEFGKFSYRARTAERRTIMASIAHAMSDVSLNRGAIPNTTGAWNPAGAPTTFKRTFDPQQPGWSLLPLEVEGQTYYSYQFVSINLPPAQPTLVIEAAGDLDGDGAQSSKTIAYLAFGNAYQEVFENPAEGKEDVGTF